MQKLSLGDLPITGLPLYEMQRIFQTAGAHSEVTISLVTLLPGRRVPTEGTGRHDEDEYSVFIEGEVYTESGDFHGICRAGEATLIPRGEAHWCENRTDQPCRLLCVLVK